MPIDLDDIATGGRDHGGSFVLDGIYDNLLDKAMAGAQRTDARLAHADFSPGLAEHQRAALNARSPVTVAAARRLDALSRGEPVEIPAGMVRAPGAPVWLEDARTVTVYTDDRVELAETKEDMLRRAKGIAVSTGSN